MLLLDEPLSALDAKVRVQLRDEIRRIQLDARRHHHVRHPRPGGGAVDGRPGRRDARTAASSSATPRRLYDRPATPFVAEFVGAMNHLPGVVVGRTGSPVARADCWP